MENKNNISKRILIGSIIVLVSLIVNVLYARLQRISEPIFFEHYIEETVYEDQSSFIEIHYITNANETKTLNSIKFPQISDNLYIEYSNLDRGKYYNHHTGRLQLRLFEEDIEKLENNKNIILKNGLARFSDGSEQPIDIGKIVLIKREMNKERLETVMSRSSSDQTTTTSYKIDKEIKITKMESELMNEISDIFRIEILEDYNFHRGEESRINIRDLKFPITVNKYLTINTEAVPVNKQLFFSRILLKLHYEDLDNNQGVIELLNMRYRPYLSEREIREYVKSKGE